MKIVATAIRPAAGGGWEADDSLDPITLGDDDNGDAVVDPPLLPRERRAVQITELAFGDRQFAIGRGNRLTEFDWVVTRDHETAAAARAFAVGHAAAVPINCKIEISDGDVTATFSSAVIVAVEEAEHYGTATTFRYRVEGAVPVPAESD